MNTQEALAVARIKERMADAEKEHQSYMRGLLFALEAFQLQRETRTATKHPAAEDGAPATRLSPEPQPERDRRAVHRQTTTERGTVREEPRPPLAAKRRYPAGSRRHALRLVVSGMPEPFTTASVAVASGQSKKLASASLAAWLANGELAYGGKQDGLKTYTRTAQWPTRPAQPAAHESGDGWKRIGHGPASDAG